MINPATSADISEGILATFAACLLLAVHTLLTLGSNLWLLPLVPLLSLLLLTRVPLAFAGLCLVFILFQNLFASTGTGLVEDERELTAMLGSNYLLAVLGSGMALLSFLTGKKHADPTTSLQKIVLLALALCLVYAAYGATRSSPTSSLTYLRSTSFGLLLLLIGLYLGPRLRQKSFNALFGILGMLFCVYGLLEIAFPELLYKAVNAAGYMALKYQDDQTVYNEHTLTDRTFRDAADVVRFNTRTWLNLTGSYALNLEMLRPMGPNMHPISYGYALGLSALYFFTSRRRILCVISLFLLLAVGAKGPLVMVCAALFITLCYSMGGNTAFVIVAGSFSLTYTGIVFSYGLSTQDFHVIGLVAGLKSLVTAPWGHGIGVGGNMSDLARQGRDFIEMQRSGATYALDSAWGVLAYQMGVFGLVIPYILLRTVRELLKTGNRAATVWAAALIIVFCNAFFQEEALAPAGWGLLLLLAGLQIAWHQNRPPVEAT